MTADQVPDMLVLKSPPPTHTHELDGATDVTGVGDGRTLVSVDQCMSLSEKYEPQGKVLGT